jgi:hypothetical protein
MESAARREVADNGRSVGSVKWLERRRLSAGVRPREHNHPQRGAGTMLTKRDLLRSTALAAITVTTAKAVPANAQAKAEWPDIREAKAIVGVGEDFA